MIKQADFEKMRAWIRSSRNLMAPLITISDPTVIETISFLNPDMIILDMEHSVMEPRDLQLSIMAAGEIPVLARIRGLEKNEIKKVLDAGSAGIIVPGIEYLEEVRNCISWSRFPPEGTRGVGPGRVSGFGYSFSAYSKQRPLLFIQVETAKALADVENIARVPGLDGIFIGPVDLSTSLGIPFSWNNREFISAVDRIISAAVKNNLITAIYSPLKEETLAEVKKRGFNFIMMGMDREAIIQTYSKYMKN